MAMSPPHHRRRSHPIMKKLILTIAAASALALAGCSTDTASPPAESSAPVEQADAATASATPLSQEDWVNLCGPEGTAPDDPQCFEDSANPTVKVGEWGELVQTYDDGETQSSGIRVDKVDYKTTLPEAASNPDWEGGDEPPQYIDATVEDGYKFAVIEYTVKNTSKKPNMPQFPGSVLTDNDAEFAPSTEDEEAGDNLGEQNEENHGTDINPGQEIQQFLVVSIEESDEVKSVYFTDPYMESYEILQIDL